MLIPIEDKELSSNIGKYIVQKEIAVTNISTGEQSLERFFICSCAEKEVAEGIAYMLTQQTKARHIVKEI